MKKIIITLTLATVALGAFAQGNVTIVNNSSTTVRFSTDTSLLKSTDTALAGTGIFTATGNGGLAVWKMEVWGNPVAGSPESSLAPLTLTVAGAPVSSLALPFSIAGRFNGTAAILPASYPGGISSSPVLNSFEYRFFDSSAGSSYTAALAAGGYTGKSAVFNMNPGPSTANSMVSLVSPSFSTIPTGPIYVGLVPEPTAAAIAGLGLASMLVFRRKK